jgi:hypothetical protein
MPISIFLGLMYLELPTEKKKRKSFLNPDNACKLTVLSAVGLYTDLERELCAHRF